MKPKNQSKIAFCVFAFTERFEFIIVCFHVLEKARFDAKQIFSDLHSWNDKRDKETKKKGLLEIKYIFDEKTESNQIQLA